MGLLQEIRKRTLANQLKVYGAGQRETELVAEAAVLIQARDAGELDGDGYRRLGKLGKNLPDLEEALKNIEFNKVRLQNG